MVGKQIFKDLGSSFDGGVNKTNSLNDVESGMIEANELETAEKVSIDSFYSEVEPNYIKLLPVHKSNAYKAWKKEYVNSTYFYISFKYNEGSAVPNTATSGQTIMNPPDSYSYSGPGAMPNSDNFGPGSTSSTSSVTQTESTKTVYEMWRFKKVFKKGRPGLVRESTAGQLQKAISTWYKTLRIIALVGLLSVLVYLGIKIILSSTGQEKAKYKNRIKDWLVAICLLFVLHYIMAFTMQITESILNIFSENSNLIGTNGEDVIMTDIRKTIADPDEDGIYEGISESTDFVKIFSSLIVYIVLVIYTIMFTLQYAKRVVMLAFLTMIAPLITLTYPLDKIKDGKAQAFGIWIKEYVFNALLPVVHIVLYYMLIGSAKEFILTGGNWLYAIVAVGFLVPAERFFRKMFGFDQANSVGQLGAAAGGALVMSALSKMGQKVGKQAMGKSSGAGESGSKTPRFISNDTNSGDRESIGNKQQSKKEIKDASGKPIGQAGRAFGRDVAGASQKTSLLNKQSIKNGAKTLGGHYFNRGNGIRAAKAAGRGMRKGAIGALGAATLGTVGLAAGVATGDLGNVLKFGAGAAGAGFIGANNLGDRATEFEKQNREIYKEGALGTEEYNTRNSIKELTRDNDFNRVCRDLGITNQEGRKELIRQFHSNGITDAQDIKKAMNVRASNRGVSQNEIIAAQKIRQQAKQDGRKRKDIEQSLRDKGLEDTEITKAMKLIDQL